MKLEHIDLGKLSVSPANMRHGKKPPNIANILPSVRRRGILVPLLVRPNGSEGHFEIVAGRRRFFAAQTVLAEGGEVEPLPCAIMEADDDAAALEASLIENFARLDPDEVSQWENFTRLVKEGKEQSDIAMTFGITELMVRRILALGNLLPRIRHLYRKGEIEAGTVRYLTLATKAKQSAWLALHRDPDGYAPTGQRLKAWLFGGQSIATKVALFPLTDYSAPLISDLFGDDCYFSDSEGFWTLQRAAIEAKRQAYLDQGWAGVEILEPGHMFQRWEHEGVGKGQGGKVYIAIAHDGEVTCHEGWLTRREAKRRNDGEVGAAPKPVRPEVSSALASYLDLHRHAAVRAKLCSAPHIALRVVLAHMMAGSSLWSVRVEPQRAAKAEIGESVAHSLSETSFAEAQQAAALLLEADPDRLTITKSYGGSHDTAAIFTRLLALSDAETLSILAVVMGETLEAGSELVDMLGAQLAVDMRDVWQADALFTELVRDREVLSHMLTEVAGPDVAQANAGEKIKTQKAILLDHLTGAHGRAKVEGWLPRWLSFPALTYTGRGRTVEGAIGPRS